MKPIDYLRAMTKRKPKYATGALVNATYQPSNEDGCTLTIDNSVDGQMTMPTGFVEFEGMLTEAEVEQIRQRFQTTQKTKVSDSIPMLCPCVAIYSECRCVTTNADFRTDQQRKTIRP